MRTSIGGRITLPARPTDVSVSDQAALQNLRDSYMTKLLEQLQEVSMIQRQLSKSSHEVGRLERTIKNIDQLGKKRGFDLRQELTD